MRTIRSLRNAGCPVVVLKRAADLLYAEWKATLSDAVLVWDGTDLLTLTPAGEVVSLVTRQGQGLFSDAVFQSVTCPIGTWERQLATQLAERDPVPAAEIRRRHAERIARAGEREWGSDVIGAGRR